jgi:hypothetical protein
MHVSDDVGSIFDMRVLRDAHMPTHVLAARQSDQGHRTPPTMLPIDATLFEEGFQLNFNIPPVPPGSTAPVPRIDEETRMLTVSLPVISITVPHVESLPLLLLYAMKLETDLIVLARNLLPGQVLGEFPSLPAMITFLSPPMGHQSFERIFRFNQGMRNNTLAMVPRADSLQTVISNGWNAVAEAHRARQREAGQ